MIFRCGYSEDDKGYDLFIKIRKEESFLETFYSMSNSKGYYFTSDSSDCVGEGCEWDIDHEQILCDYFGIEELKLEINFMKVFGKRILTIDSNRIIFFNILNVKYIKWKRMSL